METLLFIIAAEILLLGALLAHKTNAFLSPKARTLKAVIWESLREAYECDSVIEFLKDHEAKRINNLISYNLQRLNNLKRKQSTGRNDEPTKIEIGAIEQQIVEYKGFLVQNENLAKVSEGKSAMLKNKARFVERLLRKERFSFLNIINRPSSERSMGN